MPQKQLYERMNKVVDRLDEVTIALLGSSTGKRAELMAERRALLNEASRTWEMLQRQTPQLLPRKTINVPLS